MSINRVMITGNLTRDPELRVTPGGTSVLELGVAVNERRRGQGGEWSDYANYVDCTMFGKRAEGMSSWLRKGMKVAVEGRLRYSSWMKDDQRRSKLSVMVDEIDVMAKRQDQPAQQAAQQAAMPAAMPAAPGTYGYNADAYGGQPYQEELYPGEAVF